MLALEWQDISEAESATLLSEVAQATPLQLASTTTKIRKASLSCYENYALYEMADTTKPAPNAHYMLYTAGDVNLMNWTNEPIYRVNEKAPIKLDRRTVIPYAKFFFHFVRGQLGRFIIIVEKPEEVAWLPEATAADKASVNERLLPISYKGIGKDNLITLTCTVVFKNALFRTDIKIAPTEIDVPDSETGEDEHFTIGQMKLTNEELLLEDLPIPIAPPPTEFG